jgi:hypothetical protein
MAIPVLLTDVVPVAAPTVIDRTCPEVTAVLNIETPPAPPPRAPAPAFDDAFPPLPPPPVAVIFIRETPTGTVNVNVPVPVFAIGEPLEFATVVG